MFLEEHVMDISGLLRKKLRFRPTGSSDELQKIQVLGCFLSAEKLHLIVAYSDNEEKMVETLKFDDYTFWLA